MKNKKNLLYFSHGSAVLLTRRDEMSETKTFEVFQDEKDYTDIIMLAMQSKASVVNLLSTKNAQWVNGFENGTPVLVQLIYDTDQHVIATQSRYAKPFESVQEPGGLWVYPEFEGQLMIENGECFGAGPSFGFMAKEVDAQTAQDMIDHDIDGLIIADGRYFVRAAK